MTMGDEKSENVQTNASLNKGEDDPALNQNNNKSEEQEWTELMGTDLMMKTLEASPLSDATSLNHQDLVLVDLIGREASSPDQTDGPIFQQETDCWIVIGDKDVLPAAEMGIRFASVGETILVWSKSKFAYGLSTRQHEDYELPPDSSVCYEIKVKRLVSDKERSEKHLHWTVTVAESKKNIANDAYAHEWSNGRGEARISYIYQKTAKELGMIVDSNIDKDTMSQEDLDLLEKAKSILIDCLNNITAVHLRSKEYHKAKEAAVRVLQLDPNNFKGLIRAAKAALLDPASSYEEVDAAIQAASEHATGVEERDLQKLRADFLKRKKQYEMQSKQIYSKAFGGNKTNTKEAAQSQEAAADESSQNEKAVEEPENEENVQAFSWSDRSTWPWRSIFAYLFQLSMPIIMWSIAQRFRDDSPSAQLRSFFPPSVMETVVDDAIPDPSQEDEF